MQDLENVLLHIQLLYYSTSLSSIIFSNGFRSVQTRYRPTTRPKIEFHGSVGIGLAGTDHRVGTKAVIPRYRSVRVHSKLIPSRSHRSLIFKYPTGYRSCQWWCRYSRHLLCTYIRIHEQGVVTGVGLLISLRLHIRSLIVTLVSIISSMWQEPFSLQRPECISRHITHYVQNRPGTRPFLGRFGPRLWATRSSTSRIGTKPSRLRSGSISSSGSTDTRFELPDPIPRTNRPVRVHLNTETRRDRNPLLTRTNCHHFLYQQQCTQ